MNRNNIVLLFSILLLWGLNYSKAHAQSVTDLINLNQVVSDTVVVPKKALSIDGLIKKNERYSISLNHINMVLGRGSDSTLILEQLPRIESILTAINTRLNEGNRRVNLRYLSSLNNLLENLKQQLGGFKRIVDKELNLLEEIEVQLTEIKTDETLISALMDTTLLPEYSKQTSLIEKRWFRADSLYQRQLIRISNLQSKISNFNITIYDFQEEIDERQRVLKTSLFQKETNHIWERSNIIHERSLNEIIFDSFNLSKVIIRRYVQQHIFTHIFILLIWIGVYILVLYLLKNIALKEFKDLIFERTDLIKRSTKISSAIIILPIAPFFYSIPPETFVMGLQFFTTILATLLLKKISEKKIFLNWLMIFALYIIYAGSNLYPEAAYQERWWLLIMSIVGIFSALSLFKLTKGSKELYARYLGGMSMVFLSLQVFSLVANIFGRYTLAKMLGVAATLSFVQAISLFLFVLVILEVIYLLTEVSKSDTGEYTSYFDFQKLQSKIKNFFIGIALLIWLYYFTSNLSIYEFLKENVLFFLEEDRKLGNNTFTFGSILTFFLVIWIASIFAKYTAYFAEIKDQQNVSGVRDQKLGSSILLIRLGVFIVGFFLAVTASGLPLDKIAIVLGALSVGIGFGLQTIVNNLVSGVILAFERPIQIGDTIEVGGRIGTVQEVGIRSSKIKSFDGSEVIIPNGDLLSQHLINWTLSDKQRRVELLIGVAYGSDADKVKEILFGVLDREGILTVPPQRVFLQNFADSAVEFRVLFWVDNLETWLLMRSEVMEAIYKRFKEESIEIPFPQRDLHIKSLSESVREKISSIKDLGQKG